jgi:DNA-binding response OmpR family regulator
LTSNPNLGLDVHHKSQGEAPVAGEAAFILLVEDDPDISAIAIMALHLDPNFTVTAMRTGSDAIQHLEHSPRPDIILIDNNLPDMEGVALLQSIKVNMEDAPPIAFLTAAVRSSDVERYTAAGAAGTIAKPFDPISLAAQVRALLPSTLG